METTAHRQLKALFGREEGDREVAIAGFRIDAVQAGELIEIQCGSFSAIRAKIKRLVVRHRVRLVKPLIERKIIVRLNRSDGGALSRRASPRKESILHVFDDLVYLVGVFPHPKLSIQVLLTEQEEHRVSRRRRRWRGKDYEVRDRHLISVGAGKLIRTPADLQALLPPGLECDFTTEDLARAADVPRWLAQKMAYCLRKTGALDVIGKRGNAWLYHRDPLRTDAA